MLLVAFSLLTAITIIVAGLWRNNLSQGKAPESILNVGEKHVEWPCLNVEMSLLASVCAVMHRSAHNTYSIATTHRCVLYLYKQKSKNIRDIL